MSKFHEFLQQDNNVTFYNKDEFAFIIKWNGFDLVVTDETPPEAKQFTFGITSKTVIYRCDINALDPKPQIDEQVDINGKRWRVVSSQEITNDLVVRLERLDV